MSSQKKRKIDSENRVFNIEWEYDYFFVQSKNGMVCLICRANLTTIKKFNAEKHYGTHINMPICRLDGECRKEKILELKKSIKKQQTLFKNIFNLGLLQTKASYLIAHLMGKRGKPYSDSEFIKEAITTTVKCIDPDKVEKYENLALSRRTIVSRQTDIAKNLQQKLSFLLADPNAFYSLAIDESTDSTDSAQLLIFIRIVDKNFNLREELLGMQTLKGQARGIDILEKVQDQIQKSKVNPEFLVSICTDGAPSMVGKNSGFIAKMKDIIKPLEIRSFHCILHQQNLCIKSVSLGSVFKKVNEIVIFIRSNATRHRQFRSMMENDEFHGSYDLLYHSSVRWLSEANVLKRVFDIREKIIQFFSNLNKSCDLSNIYFIIDMSFLVDIMMKQRELNLSLQGQKNNIFASWKKVKAFRATIILLRNQIKDKHFSKIHFTYLHEVTRLNYPTAEMLENYERYLTDLHTQYQSRFNDFDTFESELTLVFEPHLVEIHKVEEEFQIEIIELLNDNILINRFVQNHDIYDIWRFASKYSALQKNAQKILTIFSTTYCCESAFSHMTKIKSSQRTSLSDNHLEESLILRTSNLEPDIDQLTQAKYKKKFGSNE